jgi:hypothetical protein
MRVFRTKASRERRERSVNMYAFDEQIEMRDGMAVQIQGSWLYFLEAGSTSGESHPLGHVCRGEISPFQGSIGSPLSSCVRPNPSPTTPKSDQVLTFQILLPQVEQQHKHLAPIIRINNPGTCMNPPLARQSAPRCDPPIRAHRYRHADPRTDECFSVGGDDGGSGGVEVVACCVL